MTSKCHPERSEGSLIIGKEKLQKSLPLEKKNPKKSPFGKGRFRGIL